MVSIGRLETDDRPRWESLFRDYIAFYERDEPQATYDRAWAEFTADHRLHAFVARIDGQVVGLVHFLFHPSTSSRDVCYLQDLFTDPAVRGQGVGRGLIAAVADEAQRRDCVRVYWQTQTSNATARRLYDAVADDSGFMVYRLALPAT